jgi:hypothetical protein
MPRRNDQAEWTDTEIRRCFTLAAQGVGNPESARTLNAEFHDGKSVRTPAAVGLKRTRAGVRTARVPKPKTVYIMPDAPPGAPPRDPVEVERERQDRVRSLREEREALQAIAGERNLRTYVEKLFRGLIPTLDPPPLFRATARATRGVTVETPLLHYSDWHYGETVSADGTRGLNAYDVATAERRVDAVTANAVQIAERLRAGGGWHFPRIVVAVNGDLVTGTIHELERHGDHPNIIWSVYHAGMLLARQLRTLRAHFPAVDAFCTSGNHGRLPDARKMQSKDPTRNWDTMVALIAKTALADTPGVTLTIPDSYAVTYEVEGHTVLQSHGHDVKSWGGIPWYGINRVISGYNALEASRGGRIAAYLFGHFHSQTNLTYPGGEAFVNGSLIGGTEWTVNALGRADRPCQMLLGFHRDHGVTHRWPIYAEATPARLARAA